MKIFKIVILAAAIVCLSMPASAQSLTAEDKSELAAVIHQFHEDLETQNFQGIVGAMPPSVVADLARRNGLTEVELQAAVIQALETSIASVEMSDMEIDVSTLVLGATSIGRVFALLPTSVVIQVGPDIYRATSHTLAFKEDEH
ncbi:hypothetical protein [Roseobacter litoralis]|uniref:hypothetical protein n=1 Tax=Roseobacter litoralis TaxID=42443 RepID=UPI0024949D70|nr:hypothetical protein [Roseobacter litoralis]